MKLKKIILLLIIVTSILILSACRQPSDAVFITGIEIDENSIEESYLLETFNLSNVGIFVYKSDQSIEYKTLDSSLVQASDFEKLSRVGEHTITVFYEGFETSFTLTLKFDALNQKLHAIYTLGVNEGMIATDYNAWLESIKGEDGTSIDNIFINLLGELVIELSDGTVFNIGVIIGEDGLSVADVTINENNELIVTLSDQSVINAGVIAIQEGIGIDSININEAGELLVTLTDNTVHNLGKIIGEAAPLIELEFEDYQLQWRYQGESQWNLLSDLNQLSEIEVIRTLEALLETYMNDINFYAMLDNLISEDYVLEYELSRFENHLVSMIEEAKQSVIMVINYDTLENDTGSVGSGVIYKQEGNTYYVITNHHVIENNIALIVRHERYGNYFDIENVTVIGSDPINDIAVITFESDLVFPVVPINERTTLKMGQLIFAIGHPYGMVHFNSVTEGMISGLNRQVNFDGIDTLAIQHDAAINPGNSGGALFNLSGELIGINFAKIVGEEYEGLGYAVPISTVMKIVDDIENVGQLQRLLLGIEINTSNPLDCGVLKGVCIISASETGAAYSAGLQAGDIIIGVKKTSWEDFISVNNFGDLRHFLLSTRAHESIKIEYLRNELTFQTNDFSLNIHPEDIIED